MAVRPLQPLAQWTLVTASAAQTYQLGMVLGRHARAGQLIALQGELGAGKTTLTQGIAAGMGLSARVTSPTFTLVNEYAGEDARSLRLIHIDTYRLGDQPSHAVAESATFGLAEILDMLGAEDLLDGNGDGDGHDEGGAVAVIEWAERVAALLPADRLVITFDSDNDALAADRRRLTCRAYGPAGAALLAAARADAAA